MRVFLMTIVSFGLLIGSASAQTTDLMISEYIEGSSSNKAVEIFNGTADAITLNDYSLVFYFNGGTNPNPITFDAVTLDPGSTFVVADDNAVVELLALADQTYSGSFFNGDDVIVLEHNGLIIDSMGTLGVDPGSGWICDEGTTLNRTLRRRVDVCQGDGNVEDLFDACLDWEFFASDTFDGLGEHQTDCFSVGTDWKNWGSLKAIYR